MISLVLYIIFQDFSSVPEVQVTVKHNIPNQKQDAMNVWIENVTTSQFEVCLRESRTFDGPHSNLAVVCHISSIVVVLVVCKILLQKLLVTQYLLVVSIHRTLLLYKNTYYIKNLTPSLNKKTQIQQIPLTFLASITFCFVSPLLLTPYLKDAY